MIIQILFELLERACLWYKFVRMQIAWKTELFFSIVTITTH